VESAVWPAPLSDAVSEGIRRIEDLAMGRAVGLTEEQFRAELHPNSGSIGFEQECREVGDLPLGMARFRWR
jgi:hypothetical protein